MKYSGACLDVRVGIGRGSEGIELTVSRGFIICAVHRKLTGQENTEEKMISVGRAARQGEKMSVCPVLGTKSQRKGTLGTSGHRLEDNIKEKLTGKQRDIMKLFRLAQSKICCKVHLDTIFKILDQKINKSFHFPQVVVNKKKKQILENCCECKTPIFTFIQWPQLPLLN